MSEEISVFVSKIIGDSLVSNTKEKITNYKDYYKFLECDIFDVVTIDWKGYQLSLFVDDEGLLKSGNCGREIEGTCQPLFGNIVVCGGVDEEGNTMSVPIKMQILDLMDIIGDIKYVVK